MFERLLNLVFPNVCGFCNKIDKDGLCNDCDEMISKYKLYDIKSFRNDKTKYFDFCFCALRYEGIVRDTIIAYKFGEKSYIYKTFSKIIINNKKIYRFMKIYDIMIPVPMFKSRESVRGYNQSQLIAKEVAKHMELSFKKDILIKTKDTKVQSTLSKVKRKNNIKGAFEVRDNEKIKGKNIILFDDIYTTGSTVNECGKVLKQAGAKNVLVITIAKD